MNSFVLRHHRKWFYVFWILIGIVQAARTNLIGDEAYYWLYSRYLSWGYFDHPPMTALLVKAGYAVFQNELGVRLLSVVLNMFTILILDVLTERKNPFLFYSTVVGITAFQVLGFLAVPDNALLFFTALFFYAYKKFVNRQALMNILFIAFATVLLLYTKYQGVLVIIFTLVSNIRLLAKRQTWLAGLFALLFYAPHLYWQWQNDWIGIRYQLLENNVNAYKISFTTDYVLGQLLLAGPLIGVLLLPAALAYTPQNKIDKALKFTMVGIYAFFFISTFRGPSEVNWPAPALIPLTILSYHYFLGHGRFLKSLQVIAGISLVLTLAFRIYMMFDVGPDNGVKNRFHAASRWVPELEKKTGNYPVIFTNSYQYPSLFWFYSGKPSHEIHYYTSKETNFNLWHTDLNLLGKPVFFATREISSPYKDSVLVGKEWLRLWYDSSFSPMGKMTVHAEKNRYIIRKGEALPMRIYASFPEIYRPYLDSHPSLPSQLVLGVAEGKKEIKEIETGITVYQLITGESLAIVADTKDLPAGDYTIRFTIRLKNYLEGHNSMKLRLKVE